MKNKMNNGVMDVSNMPKASIFMLDDEVNILQLVKYNLEDDGYQVYTFKESNDFFSELNRSIPDLIILDIMMPGLDGYDIMKLLKADKKYRHIPVIYLSAKGEEIDRVFGIEVGADDYLVKPFSVRELLVRVKAMLRREDRFGSKSDELLTASDIMIDLSGRKVRKSGETVELTNKEFELLRELMQNQGIVLSRSKLVENIWGHDFEGDERTVDFHIKSLRHKLGDDPIRPSYIETVRGIGYRLIRK